MALPVPEVWHVNAAVKTPGGVPFTQGKVVVYDVYGGSDYSLGESGLDTNGECTVSYSRSQFQRDDTSRTNPNLRIEVWSWQNVKLFQSTILDLASSEQAIEISLIDTAGSGGSGAWNPGQNDLISSIVPIIYGWVKNKAGLPISGRDVTAKQIVLTNGIPEQVQLGNVKTTDSTGYYAIPYSVSDLRHTLGGTPPNQLQVLVTTTSSEPYTISKVVAMTSARTRIDITAEFRSEADNSEYSRLDRAIYALLGKNGLPASYSETPDYCTYLAGRIGWAKDKVMSYAQAWNIWRTLKLRVHQYNNKLKIDNGYTPAVPTPDPYNPDTDGDDEALDSTQTDHAYKLGYFSFEGTSLNEFLLLPSFFYALTRNGLVTNFDAALELTSERMFRTVTGALDSQLIPASLNQNLDARIAKWQDVAILVLSTPTLTQDKFTALLTILATRTSETSSSVDASEIQTRVAEALRLYIDSEGDLEQFRQTVVATTPSSQNFSWNDYQKARLLLMLDVHARLTEGFLPGTMAVMANGGDWFGFLALSSLIGRSENDWFVVVTRASEYCIESYSTDGSRHHAFLPSDFPGANLVEQQYIYARKLSKRVEALFPQGIAIAKLKAWTEEYADAGTSAERKDELKPVMESLGLVPAFCEAHPDWDLDNTSVSEMDALTADIQNEEEKNALRTQLKLLLRIYRLASDLDVAVALILKKYTSAYAISRIPEDDFVADAFLAVGSFEEARRIHRLASHYSSETLFQVALNKQSLNLQGDSLKSVPRIGYTGKFRVNSGVGANDRSKLPQGNANWKILFGNPIQCSCKECQSVFGAAAYFVDLVEFLPESLRNELDSRRRDVLDMTLTCQNTNTLVPYVDLVNEVLENLISDQSFSEPLSDITRVVMDDTVDGITTYSIGSDLSGLLAGRGFRLSADATVAKGTLEDEYLVFDGSWRYILRGVRTAGSLSSITVWPTPQTAWAEDRLAAFPEHLNRSAYDVLATATYPFSLPFDLWDTETRLYLNTLDVPRHRLLAALAPNRSGAEAFAARDYFGLSATQYGLVTGDVAIDPWVRWGFASSAATTVRLSSDRSISFTGTWIQLLSVVPVLLDRTGLSLDDARTLLAMSYLSSGEITVLPINEDGYQSCATDSLRISALESGRLVKIANVVRIWKSTGWTLQELDVYLTTFQPTDASIDLVALHRFHAFQTKFGLGLVDTMALLMGMTRARVPGSTRSLYADTFLRGEYSDSVNSDFAAFPAAICGDTQSVPTSDAFRTVLARGLGISVADLVLLLSAAGDLAQPDAILVDCLYQSVSLCRILKLGVQEYLYAHRLLGDALTTFTQDGIAAAQARVTWLQSFGISFQELGYLTSNTDADSFATQSEDIQAFFDELQEQAQTIRKAYEAPEVLSQDNLTQEQLDALAEEEELRMASLHEAITLLVHTQLSSQFGLSMDTVRYLLETVLTSVDPAKPDEPALSDWEEVPSEKAYHLMAKVARVLTGFGIDQALLQFFQETTGSLPTTFRWNDLAPADNPGDGMDWSGMEALVGCCFMVANLDLSQDAVLSVWKSGLDPAAQFAWGALAEAWKIPEADLLWLADSGHVHVVPANLGPDGIGAWIRLHEAWSEFRKSGLTTGQLDNLVLAEPTMETTLSLRETMQERMGTSAWYQKIAPARNQLRERQRDALVVYLTSRTIGNLSFQTANDLYDHFLIDTQMNSEVKTSRIVWATNSVQLLVQRSLWGLEGGGLPALNDEQKEQWTWMQNYRVWEANRKVFLYPENWLEPELRDDKTQIFRELEEELNQGEVDEAAAEAGLRHYLEKLRTLANLCIIGAFRVPGGMDGTSSVLHVVGRTYTIPYQYYYRRYNQKDALKGVWEPWIKVEAEIGGPAVIPAVFNERFYLFWPTYQVVDPPKKEATHSEQGWYGDPPSAADNTSASSGKVVQIMLNWVEYQGGVWSPIRQTENSVFHTQNPVVNFDPKSPLVSCYYNFRVQIVSSDYLQVLVFNTSDENIEFKPNMEWLRATQLLGYLGGFVIGRDGQNLAFAATEEEAVQKAAVSDVYPSRTRLIFNLGLETSVAAGQDSGSDTLSYPKGNILLYNTPDGFWVMPTNFDFFADATEFQNSPFFYSDGGHTFLVEPVANSMQEGFSPENQKAYRFTTVSHPLVAEFLERMTRDGIPAMMARSTQALPAAEASYYSYNYYNYYFNVYLGYMIAGDWRAWDVAQDQFLFRYLPKNSVAQPYPVDTVDFDFGSSMGTYNWELFFHVPLLIAQALGRNQKFTESFQWFHNIFDPKERLNGYERAQRWTANLPAGARYWKFLPFFANPDVKLDEAESVGFSTSSSRPDAGALATLVDEWKNNPFNPHLIARHRIAAYQKSVVMKYLDNLIAWGDQLFLQDTMESVNQATQVYMLASDLLGQRPEEVPSFLERAPLSVRDLQRLHTDALGNVMVGAEDAFLTTSSAMRESLQRGLRPQTRQALAVGVRMLYFGTPRNENLLHYWDVISDRLFKIRNSMNLAGAKRQLALFAPPIDPGMLVRAAAAGLDLGAVLAGMSAPLPNYRFRRWITKAMELAGEVKALGGQLLAALEKKDSEALSLLRGRQETDLLSVNKLVRQLQIDEAEENIVVLQKNRATTEERYNFYRDIEKWIAPEELQVGLMAGAQVSLLAAQLTRVLGATVKQAPEITVGAMIGFGGGPIAVSLVTGGSKLAAIPEAAATALEMLAASANVAASVSGIKASTDRRWDDWKLQERLAEKELASVDQQILAAEIRREIAKQELANLELQIQHSQETYTFLSTKYTSKDLYTWMVGEVGKLYNNAFQLAFEVAKKAERTYQFELGLDATSASFIKSGHWDSLHKGLLAGERLTADLQRLDVAYLDNNKREQEVVKTVSLAQFAPDQLQALRDNGSCTIEVPEWLLDLDFPGQYMRRIRAVRVTVPCVAGPHTSIGARLTLTSNKIRRTTSPVADTAAGHYADTYYQAGIAGSPQVSISQGIADSGMFELSFSDERYLPFEGAGAISSWELALAGSNEGSDSDPTTGLRTFDYSTIGDVVLQISFTAREDSVLRKKAKAAVSTLANLMLTGQALKASINLRREFPDAFEAIVAGGYGEVTLTDRHFPYIFHGAELTIDALALEAHDGSGELLGGTVSADELASDGVTWEACALNNIASIDGKRRRYSIAGITDRNQIADIILSFQFTATT